MELSFSTIPKKYAIYTVCRLETEIQSMFYSSDMPVSRSQFYYVWFKKNYYW